MNRLRSSTTWDQSRIMPKDWIVHKTEIVHLYTNGRKLEDVRQILQTKRGFQASTRAYRMKLDEWGVRKNKTARKLPKRNPTIAGSEITTPSPVRVQRHGRKTSFSQGIFDEVKNQQSQHPQTAGQSQLLPPSPGLGPSIATKDVVQTLSPLFTLILPSVYPEPRLSQSPVWGPPNTKVVNSSFYFYSDRLDIASLQMLANSPSLSNNALDIILINWKTRHPNHIYLQYAQAFLNHPQYCRSIFNYNLMCPWTRTKFDIIYENVPDNQEKETLFRGLLKADLQFGHQLHGLYPSWAALWRKASQQKDWVQAKEVLETRHPRPQIHSCALTVMREYFDQMEALFVGV